MTLKLSPAETVLKLQDRIESLSAEYADIESQLPALTVSDALGDKKAQTKHTEFNHRIREIEDSQKTLTKALNIAHEDAASVESISKRAARVQANDETIKASAAAQKRLIKTIGPNAIQGAADFAEQIRALKAAGVEINANVDVDAIVQAVERRANTLKASAAMDPESMERSAESDAWAYASDAADIMLGHRERPVPHVARQMYSLPSGKSEGHKFDDWELLSAIKFQSEDDYDRVAFQLIHQSLTFNHRAVVDESSFADLGSSMAAA